MGASMVANGNRCLATAGQLAKPPVHRIIIAPTVDREGKPRYSQRGPLYAAWFEGKIIITASVQPFLDACRILQARGLKGTLEMWDRERPYPRLRYPIDQGAKLTVQEGEARPAFGKWKASSFPGDQAKDRRFHSSTDTRSISQMAEGGVTASVPQAKEVIA